MPLLCLWSSRNIIHASQAYTPVLQLYGYFITWNNLSASSYESYKLSGPQAKPWLVIRLCQSALSQTLTFYFCTSTKQICHCTGWVENSCYQQKREFACMAGFLNWCMGLSWSCNFRLEQSQQNFLNSILETYRLGRSQPGERQWFQLLC